MAQDDNMASFVPLANIYPTAGTWTQGVSSNLHTLNHTAAANSPVLRAPIQIPGNLTLYAGAVLKSVDVFWSTATLDITDISVAIFLNNLPLSGGAQSVTSVAFDYDADHNTTAKRKVIGVHKMSLVLQNGQRMVGDQEVFAEITVACTATAVFKLMGIKANWGLRV